MAAITAGLVKELRERTGAGMLDCKKALEQHDGDIEKAIDYLREKGIAKAVKKAGRIAAEGLVFDGVTADHKKAVVLEFNSETDFVAKNEEFKNFGRSEEHTSELQSRQYLVCRLLLEKKKKTSPLYHSPS